MGCYDWLQDRDEFPSLTCDQDWDDCEVDDQDDDDTGLTLLDVSGDYNDEWQIVTRHTTYADIVKKVARTNGPFQNRKPTTVPAKLKHKTINQPFFNKKDIVDDDDDDAIAGSELHVLRKSRSRRRFKGDAWIYQQRVTTITRLGYGSSIQGVVYYSTDEHIPAFDGPVDRLTFLHFWRYICKEDPEPEVDRLRKDLVKSLAVLTA
ncbi:hypothetical protein BCR42DRAFT_428840 [Absidia repens]|uniref:Uncharacterized protein n=1 Tax=Absidia repens TaxID=90262 RepID=A0A1X2HXT5_9FUNG|nr:hypothetical protein BCR42DRAFT_428840 [Absidia repens]